jgi:HEAT repeat protein
VRKRPDPATSEQPDIESLIETTKSEDPMRRLQSVSTLAASGNADQETVNAALDAAFTDEDAVVRAQAVQALVTRGGPEATGYLEQALRDQDPGVRIMALQSVVLEQHGVDLVKQALSDADPTVRAMAQAMLPPETE